MQVKVFVQLLHLHSWLGIDVSPTNSAATGLKDFCPEDQSASTSGHFPVTELYDTDTYAPDPSVLSSLLFFQGHREGYKLYFQ